MKALPAAGRPARPGVLLRDRLGPAHRRGRPLLRPHPDRREVAPHRHLGRQQLGWRRREAAPAGRLRRAAGEGPGRVPVGARHPGRRGLRDVRRPDYETICGFGANLLVDDLDIVTACHDACNRAGIDAVSASATIAWACEAIEEGLLTAADLDGIEARWGNGEAALALTVKMGTGRGRRAARGRPAPRRDRSGRAAAPRLLRSDAMGSRDRAAGAGPRGGARDRGAPRRLPRRVSGGGRARWRGSCGSTC